MTVRGLLGRVRWYVRELSGEAAYDRAYARFVERHRAAHPDAPAPSRREFERHRRSPDPGVRCC